jgi:hypothetical protein
MNKDGDKETPNKWIPQKQQQPTLGKTQEQLPEGSREFSKKEGDLDEELNMEKTASAD